MSDDVSLIRQFGLLRLLAWIIACLPLLALPLLGILWLWQQGEILYWIGALTLAGGCGFGLHALSRWREKRRPVQPGTQPNPHWPQAAESPWQAVDKLADSLTLADYPLEEGARLWQLGCNTLEQVARHYHPGRQQPLLEMTLPHALLVIERASRELRQLVTENIPLSHQLTLGDVTRAKRWKDTFDRYENIYRVASAVVDPAGAVFREFRREVGSRIFGYGSDKVQTWLLQEYVRKVGYYAIDLYSGNLLLDDSTPVTATTAASREAWQQATAEQIAQDEEPLRILVLGRTNAGKSSLLNALFGELKTAADILPDTTSELIPLHLDQDGITRALIFDSPGFDSDLLRGKALKQAVDQADLILLVSPANVADRAGEKAQLEQIRRWQKDQPKRRPPPLLLVLSHIDLLRPVREWHPPYRLDEPDSPKARAIREATEAACTDLAIPPEDCVPVCLASDRLYNVEDVLWAAILVRQEDAQRARFLRCMSQRQKKENWRLLWQQIGNSGRLLKPLLKF